MALITLQEAKEFLNITVTTFDSELTSFVAAASQMWTSRGLPGGASAWDERYDGGSERISLRHTPVLSVTLVAESIGTQTYTLTEQPLGSGGSSAWAYTLDASTGLLVRRAAGTAVSFAHGVANVRVTYTAGLTDTPEDIKHAIKLLTKHLWETQRGGAKRPGSGGEEQSQAAFSWPWRVNEIARAYYVPGIA